MNKREQKARERADFSALVDAKLKEAHVAADKASKKFALGAKRTAEGHIADMCGGAMLTVFKPSYRLRETLKAMDEISKGYGGGWIISGGWSTVPDQSITLGEKACEAALKVFEQAFPNEGSFYVRSYVD